MPDRRPRLAGELDQGLAQGAGTVDRGRKGQPQHAIAQSEIGAVGIETDHTPGAIARTEQVTANPGGRDTSKLTSTEVSLSSL